VNKRLFVDYENVTDLSGIDLESYDEVYLFLGAKQTKVDFSKFPNQRVVDLKVIKVDTVGKDSLDMHISLYLGRFDALLPKEIEFDVLSNDKGYDGVLKYINDSGRKTERISLKKASPHQETGIANSSSQTTKARKTPPQQKKSKAVVASKKAVNSELADAIIKFRGRSSGRPKSFSGLQNMLKSHKVTFNEQELFSALRRVSIAVDDNGKLQW
jgi:hypothetical protein